MHQLQAAARSSCFGGSGLSLVDFSNSTGLEVLGGPGAELGWWIYGFNFHEFHRKRTRTRVSWVSWVRELTCWAHAKVEVPQTSVMCQRMPQCDPGVWPEFLASAVILHDSSVFFLPKTSQHVRNISQKPRSRQIQMDFYVFLAEIHPGPIRGSLCPPAVALHCHRW